MPNIAQILKEEIRRIAKSQTKLMTADLKKDVVKLKRTAAEQKGRLAMLERDNRWLVEAEKRRIKAAPAVAPAKEAKARITAKGLRALRKKLGLSQGAFAKLIGVSLATVFLWEQKQGALTLRGAQTRANILAIRNIGAKEARRRLELLG